MRVDWTVLSFTNHHVEAQIFTPDQGSRQAVLFCPGFPGAGGTVFEQRHAAALVGEGYAVIVLRHAGTRLDTPYAPLMVNNAARLMQGRRNGDTHLGGGPSTLMHWMLEPLTALRAIENSYDRIDIIGNSFGALSSLWSLTEGLVDLSKIGSLVMLAGAQGVHTDDERTDVLAHWKPEYITVPRITDKVTLDGPEEILATLKAVYTQLPERVSERLPDHISITYIVVQADEILAPGNTDRFRAVIGGRGEIVEEYGKGHYDAGLLAHDTPDFLTENLLNLLRK